MNAAIEKVGAEIRINIFPKQREFIESKMDDLLYGGAAGGGKSYALLIFAAKRRMEIPNSRGILFRRTYPELERSLISESKKFYGLFGARYNEQRHSWTFPNKSIQEFGHCETDGDVYAYQSAEYQDMGFDEATHFTQFQFSYLTSRVRSSISGVQTLVRLASNPGGTGHGWIYKRYILPYKYHKSWKDTKTEKSLSFIPATVHDNPALMENDPNYLLRLKELPEKKYLALAKGRWDVFEGAYFTEWNDTPGFSVMTKVRKPDTWTLKFISMDWGFADPACVLWWEITPLGRVFIYRELYCTRLSPKELARQILEMSPENETYMYLKASPEIWGKKVETENGGETIQALMESVLSVRMPMEKANNARVPGWLKCREYMGAAPDGRPWLQISPNCENLIRTLPTLVHDDRASGNPEDVSPLCEDHAAEAMRYGAVTLKDVPRSANSANVSDYEKIFGIQDELARRFQEIPFINHGGYG